MATSSSRSPSYEAFLTHLDTLRTAITDPGGLATGLYERGLIDRRNYQRANLTTLSQLERSQELLHALDSRLECDVGAFDTFLAVISRDPAMEEICKLLWECRETLSAVCEPRTTTAQAADGGADGHDLPRQTSDNSAIGSEGRQSLPTSPVSPQLPLCLYSDKTVMLSGGEVKEGVYNFKTLFTDMVTDTQTALHNSKVEPLKVVNLLVLPDAEFQSCCEDKDFFDGLNEAENILVLFNKLNKQYWDHFNYYLLEKLIGERVIEKFVESTFQIMCINLQKRMKDYAVEMEAFRRRTSVEIYHKVIPQPKRPVPPEFVEVVKEHKLSNMKTLHDVEMFRREFAYEYKLRNCLVFLKYINKGSVLITLWVPRSVDLPLELQVFTGEDVNTGLFVDPSYFRGGSQTDPHPPEVEELPPDSELPVQGESSKAFDDELSITSPISPQSVLSPSELTPMDDKLTEEELVKFPHLAEKIEARYRTRRNVQVEVEKLQRKFEKLRSAACTAVANTQIDVPSFVNVIMGLPGVRGAHDKNFFMEYSDKLRESKSVHSVFDRLVCHWDYLHPEMYGQLIRNMPALADLRPDEEAYRNELNRFLDQTPVDEFCKIPGIEQEKDEDPPPGFTELVSIHIWNPPPPVSLRKVEEYRCKFAHTCNLQSCAVAIASIKLGSVIITMWVPESIELKLTPEFINAHNIVHMVLGGIVVHTQEPSELGTSVDPIPRVKASRAGVALHLVAKTFFKKPAIRLLRRWKTSLTVAAEHGTLSEVLELIALGEDPNPHRISTPLKEACHRGDMEIARVLLEAGADPNLVTDNWTPLMEASRLGNADMIQLLMEYGADPNTINGEDWTALMAASRNGRYEAVDVLLHHGADPNMQDHVGWSALLAAVHDHHEDIALRLTEAGANPHFQNMELLSALRLAIDNDNQDRVVDAFLDRHPDVKPGLRGAPEIDWTDKYDETDLLFACKKKSWRIAKRILHKGANPNLSNRDGESPLLSAIGYEEIEMVEELLNANADPNMATVLSHPLTLAESLDNVDIIILLKQHGAIASPALEGKQSKSYFSWIYPFTKNL